MAASLLVRTGEIENAIDKYKTLTQKKPDFVEGYMALGTLLAETNNLADAETAYLKALEIRPDFAAAANNLAWLIANKSEPDLGEALRLALMAQNAFPEDPYIADTLGWVYYKRGAYSMALTQFSFATEKRPDIPTLRYHLSMALYADGQIDQAKTELTKCLESKETFPEHVEAEKLLKGIK
jgi:Flp pilus assembly protein TadD